MVVPIHEECDEIYDRTSRPKARDGHRYPRPALRPSIPVEFYGNISIFVVDMVIRTFSALGMDSMA